MEAPSLTIQRARDLRRRLTLPEIVLWSALRGRQLNGARFRRQHPLGPFIIDFYCHAARLAVEVDGAVHDQPDRLRHDRRRDAWLEARGVRLHRVAAVDVLRDLNSVLDGIAARL